MKSELMKKSLEKQGYRFVGNHSSIKVCSWVKKALKNKDVCYKNQFYGIKTWSCMQSTCATDFCTQRCLFCWRDIEHTLPEWQGEIDEPKEILDNMIKEHALFLQGLKGNPATDLKRFEEATKPRHVALSLTGDACFYPKLPELVKEIHSRNMTTFIVTNGFNPDMLEKLYNYEEPTQMYVTLTAPNKKVFEQTCRPLIPDAWEKLIESLKILQKFKRSVVRLTLVKDLNMTDIEGYANIIKDLDIKFIEIKAAMNVGYAQQRLPYSSMPLHDEIKEFSKKLADLIGWKIIDEKENSRVVLLMKEDCPDRIMKF